MDQTAKKDIIQQDTLQPNCIENSFGKTRIKISEFTYTWVIERFIHCKNRKSGTFISSPEVVVRNSKDVHTLKLLAYPTGVNTEHANNLSLYIKNIKTTLKKDQQTNASIELSIMDSTGGKHVSSELRTDVKSDSDCIFSSPKFAKTEDVFSSYLNNGNLTLKCTIRFDDGQDEGESYEDPDAAILMTSKMSLIEDVGSLMMSSKFYDVVLVVGDKKFQAHKAILAARSPVFSAMLGSAMKESEKKVVEIKEIEPEIMAELLRFMYTSQVENIDEIAADLLAAADMYHFDILKLMCEGVLVKKLSLENLPNILKILDRHETCHSLLKSTLEFLVCNRKEATDLENFDKFMRQLSPPLLAEVSKTALKKF